MYIAITDQEQDALRGADYSLTVLYIYIKQFMDYKTGVVGYARRISYQGMSEALYIEPRPGVKGGSPHMSSIRRMVDQLLKCKILVKDRADTLVFKCPLADTENHVQNKADRKSTPITDSVKPRPLQAIAEKADRPKKAKAGTPHLSLNPMSKASSSMVESVLQEVCQQTDDDDKLIFDKSLHTDITQKMCDLVQGFKKEKQQELIDELSYYISKKKISASPLALFIAMVKQAKNGAFIAANAHSIKKLRENQKASALEKTKEAPTAEQKEINKSKGRLAMASVHDILKGKKSA
jgi:hypothetical protein